MKTNTLFSLSLSMIIAVLIVTVLVPVSSLADRTSHLPLYESTPTHCDDMIQLHRWEGSCCSLNVTEGNGCILNVMDGYCQVKGQIWTLNYSSTSDQPCPPSEYTSEQLGMKLIKTIKTEPPIAEGSGGAAPGITIATTATRIAAVVTVTLAGFAIAVL